MPRLIAALRAINDRGLGAHRVFEAIAPERVFVTGAVRVVDAVRKAGIPAHGITHDSKARITYE